MTELKEAISKRLFVEVNGGELEMIQMVYTPEGCATVILNAITNAGYAVVKVES